MSLKILALDTATEACSAALFYDNRLIERYQLAPRQHTSLILPMLQALLDEAGLTLDQLNAIGFGCGPGSFTGLRIAASVTQGIAFAHNLAVIPISTLRTLAFGSYREFNTEQVLVAIDARMNEIYWGMYQYVDNENMIAIEPEIVCAPESVVVPAGKIWMGVGSGWDSYSPILQNKVGQQLRQWFPQRYPRAADIAMLAVEEYRKNNMVSAEQALPVYLRNEVVKTG